MIETSGWHNASTYAKYYSNKNGLIRGYTYGNFSIFTYFWGWGIGNANVDAEYTKSWASRAVVVNGEGI